MKKILILQVMLLTLAFDAAFAGVTITSFGLRRKSDSGQSAEAGEVLEVKFEATIDGDDEEIDLIDRSDSFTGSNRVRAIGDTSSTTPSDNTTSNAIFGSTISISNTSFGTTGATFEVTIPTLPDSINTFQIGLAARGLDNGSSGNVSSFWSAQSPSSADFTKVNSAPAGYFTHIDIVQPSTQTPTFVSPAASSSDNSTLAYNFTLPEEATSGTVQLTFTRTGGTADANSPHTLIFSNTTAIQYTGSINATTSSPFFAVSSGLLSLTSSHTSGLVDGTIYTVQLSYQDATPNAAATVDHTNFTFDSSTSAPTITSPTTGSGAATDFDVDFNLPEDATSGTIIATITRTAGSTDIGSPHQLTINGITSSGAKTLALNTSTLGSSTISGGTVSLSGGAALAVGAIYSIELKYQDALGNSEASTTNTSITFSGSNATVNITGTPNNDTITNVNTLVYTLTMSTTSGSATLNSVIFDATGTASASDFATNGMQLVLDSNGNSTFDNDTDTVLGTQNFSGAITFSSLTQSISTSTSRLFLTARRSGTQVITDNVQFNVNEQSNFTFTGGTPAGTFPLSSSDNSLPVELTEFSAKPIYNLQNSTVGISISWTTESETNNDYFVLERKEFGQESWERISQKVFSLNGNSASSQNYTFEDLDNLKFNTTYEYRIFDVDLEGNSNLNELTAKATTVSENVLRPKTFVLEKAFPNPFNPSTNISFALPQDSKVSLRIFNLLGQEVRTLVNNEALAAQYHSYKWDGKDDLGNSVSTGVYFVKVTADKFSETQKITFLK
ncbi:MAG: T9SS C-terminal target domain-containing protein [Calditrichaeota bacterium]|nr:MAG: T9SS C-terminal target domain-containing protein [Calditrichota bacterium]